MEPIELPTDRTPAHIKPALIIAARFSVLFGFAAVFIFFGLSSQTFLTPANIVNVLVNNVALLALVALGMTIVISSGGIDLSVGTAVDLASMVFIMLMAAGHKLTIGLLGAMAAAAAVGAVNAVLIARLRISPFLATLGVLFIGQSVQQLSTDGGNPIYLFSSAVAPKFSFIGHGKLLGVAIPLWIVAASYLGAFVALQHTRFGRYVYALGAEPGVAWYSGLSIRRDTAVVYVLSAISAGVAGIILSCTVRSYVPLSGNAFILDAIGAAFIGTTISRERRPTVVGTAIGVLLLGFVKNGLLLVGWNFYWQQVGIGVVVLVVIATSFGTRRYISEA